MKYTVIAINPSSKMPETCVVESTIPPIITRSGDLVFNTDYGFMYEAYAKGVWVNVFQETK